MPYYESIHSGTLRIQINEQYVWRFCTRHDLRKDFNFKTFCILVEDKLHMHDYSKPMILDNIIMSVFRKHVSRQAAWEYKMRSSIFCGWKWLPARRVITIVFRVLGTPETWLQKSHLFNIHNSELQRSSVSKNSTWQIIEKKSRKCVAALL